MNPSGRPSMLRFLAAVVFLILLAGLSPARARGPQSVTVGVNIAAASKLLLVDFVPGPLPPPEPLAVLPDLESLGLDPAQAGTSPAWFQRNFERIRECGFDGIVYVHDGAPPDRAFVRALEETGLQATVLIDLNRLAPLSQQGWSSPVRHQVAQVLEPVLRFFRTLPADARPRTHDGYLPVFLQGLAPEVAEMPWRLRDVFFAQLVQEAEHLLDTPVRFYWQTPCPMPVLEAIPAFGEIRAINTHLEGSNPPMTDALTVNLFLDERGLWSAGLVERPAVRYDLSRVRQALWLSRQRQCAVVRFSGWNTWADGTNIAPDTVWGTRKMDIARAFVRRVREGTQGDLSDTLIRVGMPAEETAAREQWEGNGAVHPFSDVIFRGMSPITGLTRYTSILDGGEILTFRSETTTEGSPSEMKCETIFHFHTSSSRCVTNLDTIPQADLPLPFTLFASVSEIQDLTDIPTPSFIVQSATRPVELPGSLQKATAVVVERNQSRSGITTYDSDRLRAPPGSAIEVLED